jgi:hypothetical protein
MLTVSLVKRRRGWGWRFIVLPEYFHHLLRFRHLLAIAVQDRRTRWLRLLAQPGACIPLAALPSTAFDPFSAASLQLCWHPSQTGPVSGLHLLFFSLSQLQEVGPV